jgi:hypothetical protein
LIGLQLPSRAIRTFSAPDKKISIYVFGNEFTGKSIDDVVNTVDRLNRHDAQGRQRVRIHAIGFPVMFSVPGRSAEYNDAMLDAVNRKMPFGRHARPEEIAALFAFLASEDAGFASGHVYVMDGAETAGGLCSQWTHE